jgi:DNA modification methylase
MAAFRSIPPEQKPTKERHPPHRPALNKPSLTLQATSLWTYPSRTYGGKKQGDDNFRGATPAWVIWDLIQRYVPPNGLVIDPFCGSGTTLDVCQDTERRAMGFDVNPVRADIQNADARSLPVKSAIADLVFMDDPRCIGKLSPKDQRLDRALDLCFAEAHRVLRDGGVIAVYICDIYQHPSQFYPIGFRAFDLLRKRFLPLDIVSVVRQNAALEKGNYRRAAVDQGFLMRGFNYLFVLRKTPKRTSDAP